MMDARPARQHRKERIIGEPGRAAPADLDFLEWKRKAGDAGAARGRRHGAYLFV